MKKFSSSTKKEGNYGAQTELYVLRKKTYSLWKMFYCWNPLRAMIENYMISSKHIGLVDSKIVQKLSKKFSEFENSKINQMK